MIYFIFSPFSECYYILFSLCLLVLTEPQLGSREQSHIEQQIPLSPGTFKLTGYKTQCHYLSACIYILGPNFSRPKNIFQCYTPVAVLLPYNHAIKTVETQAGLCWEGSERQQRSSLSADKETPSYKPSLFFQFLFFQSLPSQLSSLDARNTVEADLGSIKLSSLAPGHS